MPQADPKAKARFIGLVLGMWAAIAVPAAGADVRWHGTDLFSRYRAWDGSEQRLSPDEAVRGFIATHAPDGDGYRWDLFRRLADHTHIHYWFRLTYDEVPFPEVILKVHYNRRGWVDFASSNWKKRQSGLTPRFAAREQRHEWTAELLYRGGEPRVESRDVFWVDENGNARPAVEMKISSPRQGVFRHFFADPDTGRVLFERKVLRAIDAEVYTVSPLANPTNFETVTLGGLTVGATSLSTPRFNVRREQNTETPELQSIDPNTDFVGTDYPNPMSDWSASPATTDYDFECIGEPDECPNQGFDGVNTYHHVQEFRDWTEVNMNALGILPSSVFAKDPIDILVNVFSVDVDGDGEQDDVNNAFYLPLPCTGGTNAPEACILFFRAENVEDPYCGTGTYQFFHLSRETVVITHEYQHYVTDMLTGLLQGTGGKFNVGDSLHEGYSDYFALSFTTEDSGVEQTLVGASAFRNCTNLQREVGEPVVLELEEGDAAANYTVGTTWASGLWALRDTLGTTGTDRVALKAMTFLPTDAGFVDSVEALVKADAELNGGINAGTIRALFYDTLKFTGAQTFTFRDQGRGVVEVGFQSCASAGGGPGPSGLLFLVWALFTLVGGRCIPRR